MAIALKVSNSLQVLLQQLCEEMTQETFSVFQPIYIVTQTDGMNNWLNYQIANQLGIAANIKFIKPNELVQSVYYNAELINETATSRETITWYLFQSLADSSFIEQFPLVAKYYQAKGADLPVKRIALAQKMADLFDQYIVYRPEMIRNWNKEKFSEDEAWQFYLWNDIKSNIGKNKIELNDELLLKLKDEQVQERIKQRFSKVYFFGISLITSYHLQVLTAISSVIDISFLMINPAPGAYWFEDRSERHLAFLRRGGNEVLPTEGNTLLLNWGKLIQNTFWLMFQNDDVINLYDELPTLEPTGNSLLQNIQRQIINNETDIEKIFTQSLIEDDSIKINSCYTILREVESLYNFIIHLIHAKKQIILPGEILVMAADIDLYAPYIKAVFESAPTKFYFTIADTSVMASDGVNAILDSLLQLTEKSFTAEQVVRLLDHKLVQSQFGIHDIELIRQAIQAANIRFGIRNDTEDETFLVSWHYGLQRIMYGIALGDEELFESEAITESFFPVNIAEGAAREQLISFVHFVGLLIKMLENRLGKKSVKDWVIYLQEIVSSFLAETVEEDDEEKQLLLLRLSGYGDLANDFTELVSFEVFLQNFSTADVGATREKKFIAGGITFCSMIPMRSIPFKMVAMLGLNHDVFPRKDRPVSFDLMQIKKKKGDRNIKDNDKHLFLETLLSAQEYFYISYIGQQVTTNVQLPASTLVDELVTYIARRCEASVNAQNIMVHQPLHSHSNKYASENGALYQFLGTTTSTKIKYLGDTNNEATIHEELDIARFTNALLYPLKHYYNNVLGIYMRNDALGLAETEDFELDTLQRWNLSRDLLHDQDIEAREWIKTSKKQGRLPLNNAGTFQAEKVVKEIETVKIIYQSLIENEINTAKEFKIDLQNLKLKGTEKNLYGNKLIFTCLSKSESKYLAEAYVHFLFVSSVDDTIECYFVSKAKEKFSKFKPVQKAEAIKRLNDLVGLYEIASKQLVPFAANLKFDEKKRGEEISIIYSNAMNKTFENKFYPCSDEYLLKGHDASIFEENGLNLFQVFYENLIRPLNDQLPDYFN